MYFENILKIFNISKLRKNCWNCIVMNAMWKRAIVTVSIALIFQELIAGEMLEAVELKGSVSMTMNLDGGKTWSYNFACLIAGYKWKITIIPASKNSYEHGVFSYDGTNYYSYIQFRRNERETNFVNSSLGGISEYKKPPILIELVDAQLPWLATASYGYFDHEEPGVAEDVWTLFDPDARTNKNKIVIHRHKNPPFLPEYIEFYNDGIKRSYVPATGKLIKQPYPPPFNEGFIIRKYTATNFIGVNNLYFPMRFEMIYISMDLNLMSFRYFKTGRGEISDYRTCKINEDELIPKMDGKTLTIDRRFTDDVLHGITYVNTNQSGQWLPKDSKVLKKIAQSEREKKLPSTVKPNVAGGARAVIFAVMIIIGVFPLLWYLARRRRTNRG